MKQKFLLLIVIVATLIINSCKENPIGPDDSNAIPGKRNYTWVVDTIDNPFLDFYTIWGNSITSIWTAGMLMSDALYRYDGEKWRLDTRVYISDPLALWGNENDVWIGNDKGCIWKFTNTSYKQELRDFKVSGQFVRFVEMTGKSSNEIFTVGDNFTYPIIMKYDGEVWQLDKILRDSALFNQIKYCYRDDKYYLVCAMFDYSTRIYEYNRKDLRMIYEYPPSNAGPTIAAIDGYAYLVIGNKIYRYFNDKKEFIFEVNDPNFGGVIWGRNRKDIFIRMQDGLAHYNGTDWRYLFQSESVILSPNSVMFDNDFFVPARIKNTGYPIIYHGILQ